MVTDRRTDEAGQESPGTVMFADDMVTQVRRGSVKVVKGGAVWFRKGGNEEQLCSRDGGQSGERRGLRGSGKSTTALLDVLEVKQERPD